MAVDIVIDAGHGGFDNGAMYRDRKEKDDVLRLALALGKRLEEEGYTVYYTRTDDTYNSPYEKAEIANQAEGRYFVSLHRNSSLEDNLYNGVQTLIYPGAQEARALGESINEQLAGVGFQNLGIETNPDLIVLRETDMPAVLLEVGFLNNDRDNEIFDDQFDQVVNAIAKGIEMNVPVRMQELPQNYAVQIGVFRYDINAAYMLERAKRAGFDGSITYDNKNYYIRVGGSDNLEDAVQLQKMLRREGFETLIVSY